METNRSTFDEEGRAVVVPQEVPIVAAEPVGAAAPLVGAEPVVAAAPVAAQPVVTAQPVVAAVAPVHEQAVRTVRSTSISPAAIIAGILAVALLVLGGITVARAGTDGPLDLPIVKVAGFTATALLGFIELGFGVVLLIAALSRAQATILFFSILGLVAALIAVFQPTIGHGSLAIERSFAVLAAIAFAVVAAAALLPTIIRRTDHVAVERV